MWELSTVRVFTIISIKMTANYRASFQEMTGITSILRWIVASGSTLFPAEDTIKIIQEERNGYCHIKC